jgi:hypothetical protein
MLAGMHRRALALVLMLPVGIAAFGQSQQEHTFVPLVGLWRAGAEAGRATFTVDGTAPAPKPDEEGAKAAFGPEAPRFVKAMSVPGVFPLATVRDVPAFASGRLSVEFKILAGATDQTAGVVFNLKPDGTYNYARYNTKDGNVAIWKFENGTRTVLAHGELHEQLPFATWHRLVVQVKGRAITASVNDKLRVTHTLDGDVAGRVGLWTKADSVTAFRAFTANQQ